MRTDFCYYAKFVNLNYTFSAALDTPHFGIHPTNKIVPEYLPALLQCQILGVPPPTIYWTFNGQPLQNAFDRYLLGNGSLYFTAPINHSYSGQYACSGTNSKGSISSRAVLFRVAYFGFSFIENPKNHTAKVGDVVSLKCVPPISFPVQVTIHWYHNYQQITPGSGISINSSGTIKFVSIKKSDEGMYFCDGKNNVLGVSRTSSQAFVTVHVPPSFQVMPQGMNVTVGSPVILHCKAMGSPNPNIAWQKDGLSVDTTHVTLLSNGSLYISSTVVQDAGRYSCKATNVAGSTSVRANIVIYGYYCVFLCSTVPSSLDFHPVNVTVNESSSAAFQCNASGDPKPTVTWFKYDTQLSSGGRFVIDENSLTILRVVASDSGAYSCNVSNGLDTHVGVAHLIVQVAPIITTFYVPQFVHLEANATLVCEVSGIPQPSVTWYRNVNFQSRAHHVTSGTYVIRNVGEADSGLHTCVASNAAGIVSRGNNLTVQVAPSSPLQLTALAQSSTVIQLSWRPGFDGHSLITGYKVEVRRESGSFMLRENNVTVLSYRVGNLDPYRTYTFRISARNAIGLGPGATVSNRTLQDAPSPPENVAAVSYNSTAIRVTWSVPTTPNGLVTRYEIQYNAAGSADVITRVLSVNRFPQLDFMIGSLKPFTRYEIRIRAATREGSILWGNFSPLAEATTGESAPIVAPQDVQLEVLATPKHSILVNWKGIPPESSNGMVRRYMVFVKATGPYRFSDSQNFSAGTDLNFTVQGLFPWTKYNISVQAVTIQPGPMSPWSQVETLEDVPGLPSNVALTSESEESIVVNIKPPAPKERNGVIIGYTVFYRQTKLLPNTDFLSVNTSNSTLRLFNLTVFTEYSIKAAAHTSVGQGKTSPTKTIFTQEGVLLPKWKSRYFGMRIAPKQTLSALFQLFLLWIDPKRTRPKRSFINLFLSFSFITTDVFPSSRPDTSPTEAIATTNSRIGAPGSTEKSTEIDREQMIIIVVCVSIIVLCIIGTAVYFLGFKRCRAEKDVAYKRNRNAFAMERPRLDVQEEPSIADTNCSSDSYDSDWDTSVASPYSIDSRVNATEDVTQPIALPPAPPPAPLQSDRSPMVRLRGKKTSIDSQGSQFDPSYSSVEELGGGFSSFGPLPPVEFRSTPIEEREPEVDTTTDPRSSNSRMSFTNGLFQVVHSPEDVNPDKGDASCEGFQEKDISGMENEGYALQEENYESVRPVSSEAKKSVANTVPKNIEEMYAKVDKSKMRRNRRKDSSSSGSGDLHNTSRVPGRQSDMQETRDPLAQIHQVSGLVKASPHDPVVVYDERTNLDVEAEPEPTTETVAKPDSPVVGRESTLSSATTVSEPDSSENTEPVPREDIVDLNPEPLQEPGQESPPPSPYVLRNRKLSVESEESFYDQPYSSLEEINAGATPSELLGTSPPQATESAVNGAETDVALENQDSPSSTADLASLLTSQPYGTMDKGDEELDVMEVKDIETQNTAKDFDEVPDDLLLENPAAEPAQIPNTFLSLLLDVYYLKKCKVFILFSPVV
ncbi:PREDICTED: Down syndrome cell adhesion molecule-like [Acropora digitifera]|uniref:Down syndrome cell adhesion molecule-like n=1 Tax=Acropora digitifera TaxID=70779 RepID=UPI00077AA31C|nr:PREDICTED: Down syndrome cell adhesion molecule-like [Acropora digitifera]